MNFQSVIQYQSNCSLSVFGSDYSLSSSIATARPNLPSEIIVTYRVDSIAQENVETAELRLLPVVGVASDGIFLDTITLRITDSDGK